jgi:hypothetical protein
MRSLALLCVLSVSAFSCPQPTPGDILDPVVRIWDGHGGGGSAVCIGSAGVGSLLVTNAHVVRSGGPYEVEKFFRWGNTEWSVRWPAELLYVDEDADLAFVSTPLHISAAPLLKGSPRLLERTWLVGYPALREVRVTIGVISSLDARLSAGGRFIASSSQIWYGNSGGALFVEREGKWYLAGIPSRIWVDGSWPGRPVPHMSYSIPIERIRGSIFRWALDVAGRAW